MVVGVGLRGERGSDRSGDQVSEHTRRGGCNEKDGVRTWRRREREERRKVGGEERREKGQGRVRWRRIGVMRNRATTHPALGHVRHLKHKEEFSTART